MKKLRSSFLKNCISLFLVFFLVSLPCFSEKSYTITESELRAIEFETNSLMMKVNELTESVKKLESQRNQYLTLSKELENENKALRSKVKAYRYVALGACSGAIISGLAVYMMRK